MEQHSTFVIKPTTVRKLERQTFVENTSTRAPISEEATLRIVRNQLYEAIARDINKRKKGSKGRWAFLVLGERKETNSSLAKSTQEGIAASEQFFSKALRAESDFKESERRRKRGSVLLCSVPHSTLCRPTVHSFVSPVSQR